MKKVLGTVAAIMVVIALGGALLWWRGWGNPPRADDVMAVANQLSVPDHWRLAEENIRDRGPLCVDVECPQAYRRWQTPDAPTAEELRGIMRQAGWRQITVEGDCRARSNMTGSFPVCQAHAMADNLRVDISVTGPRADPHWPFWVTLRVTG